jgi:hypothetical protein
VAGNVEAASVGRRVHWRVADERVRVRVADMQLPAVTHIASTGIHLRAAVCHASSAGGGGGGGRRAAVPPLPLATHELDHGGELGAVVTFASASSGDGWGGAGGERGHRAAGASTLLLLLLLGGA